jgi:hypothetical protein
MDTKEQPGTDFVIEGHGVDRVVERFTRVKSRLNYDGIRSHARVASEELEHCLRHHQNQNRSQSYGA